MSASRTKVLVIRFSSIGDIVLTSPVLRCLKNQIGATIHFLTKEQYAPIVEANTNVDRVFSFNDNLKEILSQLKTENYNYIIDLHKNIRSLRVRQSLGAKSYTFNKLNFEKWLFCNLKINRLPEVHIVDRYLKAVQALGVKNDNKGLDYFIPEKEEVGINQYELEVNSYLVLVIGAAHFTKRIPFEKLVEICDKASLPVALVGGADEEKTGVQVQQISKGTVLNLCGQLNLHQSASVIKQSKAVVTPDTGMMHIAAALKKPIKVFWGNTVPDFGMYPYLPENAPDFQSFEVSSLSCRPCSKIGYAKCPKGHFKCMLDQRIPEI